MPYPVRQSFGDVITTIDGQIQKEPLTGLPLVERAEKIARRVGLSTEEVYEILARAIRSSSKLAGI